MHKTPLVESMHSEWIAFSPSSPIHSFLLILILIVGRFLQTERGREGGRGPDRVCSDRPPAISIPAAASQSALLIE